MLWNSDLCFGTVTYALEQWSMLWNSDLCFGTVIYALEQWPMLWNSNLYALEQWPLEKWFMMNVAGRGWMELSGLPFSFEDDGSKESHDLNVDGRWDSHTNLINALNVDGMIWTWMQVRFSYKCYQCPIWFWYFKIHKS